MYYIKAPKTKGSIRTVYFNDECVNALIRQFKRRSDLTLSIDYSPIEGLDDLLFTTKYGTPLRVYYVNTAISRLVKKINERIADESNKLPEFTMHNLRHTYATRCLKVGISPKVVQKQLGHSSINMTMDLYTHVLDDFRQDEISKLDMVSADNSNIVQFVGKNVVNSDYQNYSSL
jgi:integrase